MSELHTNKRNDGRVPLSSKLDELSTEGLKRLQADVEQVIAQRTQETDLEEAEKTSLVNGEYVEWSKLSAHPNKKAVKPWIMHVTGTHDKYGVDGNWLEKQQIDGSFHMSIGDLEQGDIIKVSGASHTNKKHRYFRIVAISDSFLYYEPKRGLNESEVIEEVG